MTSLSVAIIGAGDIAGGFDERKNTGDNGVYTHAGAYNQSKEFVLNSVFDADSDKAQLFKETWNVTNVANSLDELLASHHDVISVCTPDETHASIVKSLLDKQCCKSIFVEKPLALSLDELQEIEALSVESGINVIVNFQRRHEKSHQELRKLIGHDKSQLLSVSGRYMKGLEHIGTTMVDTLCFLLGLPDSVMAYNRVWNKVVNNYSYEFILFYPDFSVSVQTTDSEQSDYTYHHFEIDLLFSDKRKTLIDISQAIREVSITDYAYSGVKVSNDREAQVTMTGYNTSMIDAVGYVAEISQGEKKHSINTPRDSYNNQLILDNIIASYKSDCKKKWIETEQWKK